MRFDGTRRESALRCSDDVGAGQLGVVVKRGDAYDSRVGDVRVEEKGLFEFGGGDLPAADFNHLLLRLASLAREDSDAQLL